MAADAHDAGFLGPLGKERWRLMLMMLASLGLLGEKGGG